MTSLPKTNVPLITAGKKSTRRAFVLLLAVSMLFTVLVCSEIVKRKTVFTCSRQNAHSPIEDTATRPLPLRNVIIDRFPSRVQRSILKNVKMDEDTTLDDILSQLARSSYDFYLHTGEFEDIMQRFGLLRQPNLPSTADKAVFIIMASSVNSERMNSKVGSYAHSLKHFYAFSDKSNITSRVLTLPELKGKPSYKDAQKRVPYGIRWLYNNKISLVKDSDWFVTGDDDTWFNVPALLKFLYKFDPNKPMAFGYLWNNTFGFGARTSGGGGLAMSRKAFNLVAPQIMTENCPHAGLVDITIDLCLVKMGVIRVHDARFHPTRFLNGFTKNNVFNDAVSQFSCHYENRADYLSRLTCYVADVYDRPNMRSRNCSSAH